MVSSRKRGIVDEINQRISKEVSPSLSSKKRIQLRRRITNEVLEERAIKAGLDPELIKRLWVHAAYLGEPFTKVELSIGL